MIRLYEVRMELNENIHHLKGKCEKKLSVEIDNIYLVKKSIDARKKNDIFYSCTVDCDVKKAIKPQKKIKFDYVDIKKYSFPTAGKSGKTIVVGSGPAGLFAALNLAKSGTPVILIERGDEVDKRIIKTNAFFDSAQLDVDTNVQFGEGGAGTFSDGKLNTGINDVRIKYVLEEFVKFGAPENILYDALPHIGTDILCRVVKNIRNEIIKLGGEVYFNTKLTDLICKNNKIIGIKTICIETEKIFECENLILAIGHSARDTIRMLYDSGLTMENKVFSIGVRIEHKQNMINSSLYGKFAKDLPAAPYKLWTHLNNGNSLYTFCMCPGGYVVNACSEKGRVVTNGMSYSSRSGENANSALLVNIKYSDNDNIFAGIKLQEQIESAAFKAAGSSYKMPVQMLGDFVNKRPGRDVGEIIPTVKPGYVPYDLTEILPEYVTDTIKAGIADFEKKIKGFSVYDAVLTAPETRSSSPVKILRDKLTHETVIKGVYVAGEGGGHAGGITSSAVDGIKTAENIVLNIK